MEQKIRVRFAPSPTGPLHMGGVRTALFNYLFAKKNNGDFLLRIEDTDQNRYVPGAEEYIIESLKWCGLSPDEGVGVGGPYGPYRQSERKEIYFKYAEQLVKSGNAYYAFDTPEELTELRTKAESEKSNFSYDTHTRGKLKNSLTLPKETVAEKIKNGEPWIIRFKMPENETVIEKDLIRGEVKFNTAQLDDKVLYKADGMPTYHLANVVDDHLMKITHVIRGEEWLSSMPLHVLLYRAFGWEETKPQFAHLPLILKPVGKGKLSKRDGDKMGFPVFPIEWHNPKTEETYRGYREDGYYPEAFINMLSLLGWNAGDDQEFFSMKELTEKFSLEHVGKAGARFNPEKAKWFNHHYLQQRNEKELTESLREQLKQKNIPSYDDAKLTRIVSLVKDRCTFASELWDNAFYLFEAPTEYEPKAVKKRWKDDTSDKIREITEFFKGTDNWGEESMKEAFSNFIEKKQWSFGQVMVPLRVCIVGSSQGLDMFIILELLGKEECIKRLNKAVKKIKK